jgi:protein ImuB
MLWLCCLPVGEGDAVDASAAAPLSAHADSAHTLCAWALLRYSPRVVVVHQSVLVEVSASVRLFGHAQRLWDMVHGDVSHLGFGLMAAGQTALGTLALARAGSLGLRLGLGKVSATASAPAPAPTWPERLHPLPLACLPHTWAHAPMLQRAGLRCLGDLHRLPRGPLTRRFGQPLLHALDQAYGQRPEAFDWVTAPERFEQSLELPHRVEDAPALLQGAQRLLLALQTWLQARHLGVLAIELSYKHDFAARAAGTGGRLAVRTGTPLRHTAHLLRLLREELNRTQLAGPVGSITLSALETQALPQHSNSFLPDSHSFTQAKDEQVQQLLERLSARLGNANVQRVSLQNDWRLEHAQTWHAAVQHNPQPSALPPAAALACPSTTPSTTPFTTPSPTAAPTSASSPSSTPGPPARLAYAMAHRMQTHAEASASPGVMPVSVHASASSAQRLPNPPKAIERSSPQHNLKPFSPLVAVKSGVVATKNIANRTPKTTHNTAATIGSRFQTPVADNLLQGLQSGSPLFAPTWLLPRPLRLHEQQGQPFYQGPLQAHAGPHRIEAAWWSNTQWPHQRDYTVAISPRTGPLLICQKSSSATSTAASAGPWYAVAVYG